MHAVAVLAVEGPSGRPSRSKASTFLIPAGVCLTDVAQMPP